MIRPLVLATACVALSGCVSTPTAELGPSASMDTASFIADRQAWTYQGNPGWLIVTPSVELRTTVEDKRLLRRMPAFLELAQSHRINAIVTLDRPREPLPTFVLGTRREWEAMTRSLLRERATPYLRIERGGFAASGRGVFYDLGPQDTLVMAAHEGWHQLVQTSFEDPLPVWLDEGIACYMEGFRWSDRNPDRPEFQPWRNQERFEQLRSASARGALMPLHRLVMSRPQDLLNTDRNGSDALTYYAQCWAFVHFMMESDGGVRRAGLERLLLDAQSGRFVDWVSEEAGNRAAANLRARRTGPAPLDAYWDEPIGDLDRAFQRFIARIVRPGGRDLALSGRSPITGE